MKTTKYIGLLLLTIMGVSCSDFLDETPLTSLDRESVYSNYDTAESVLVGCYSKMASAYTYTYLHTVESASAMAVSIKSTDEALSSLKVLSSNTNVANLYTGQYNVIGGVNDLIDGVSNSLSLSDTQKESLLGEAYFIRAMHYFNLVRLFGGVPLVVELIDMNTLHSPRATTDEVYDQIDKDLKLAFEYLPEEAPSTSRLSRYAAKALLAKSYVARAGKLAADDPTLSETYYQLAYEAALEVKNSSPYSLVADYTKLFGSQNNNNVESIVEIQYSIAAGGTRIIEHTALEGDPAMPNANSENTYGKLLPTKWAYSRIDDRDPRKLTIFRDSIYTNIFEDEDSSKRNVLLYPVTVKGSTVDGVSGSYTSGTSEYAAWTKYLDPDFTTTGGTNFVYLRYADLLLTLAEAANEVYQTDEALAALEEVRFRARDINGNGLEDEDEIYPVKITERDRDLLRDIITEERLTEFTGECDAFYTLRRRDRGYLEENISNHNILVKLRYDENEASASPSTIKYVYYYPISSVEIERAMLLPIPADEINRNSAMTSADQNPGY